MILIADSGSTKTEWCLADQGAAVRRLLTAGTNPYFQTPEEISREIRESLRPALEGMPVEAICFYGAGCASPEKNRIVEEALASYFPVPINVYSDLVGAARSLCGDRPGIACILGTGSNSCVYDGQRITDQVSPLGFILGDEGSGATLGKMLVGDCLKRQLPEPLAREFMERYELTPALLLERVYKRPFPNRYLASFSPFLREHLAEPAIHRLVYDSFRSFFVRNILVYKEYGRYPAHFVGSVAFHFQEVLREAAASVGVELGLIRQAPMEGLVEYHFKVGNQEA